MGVGVFAGTQIDIHVQAMIGEIGRDGRFVPAPWVFRGETSDWSNIQTIDIPANVPITSDFTPWPSSILPNMGPTSPSNSNSDITVNLALVAVTVLAAIVISLLLYVRHLKRTTIKPDNSAV
jgi:hypothetical protein